MINHNSSVPMYLQISRQLSEAIQQGGYNPGDKLPSESTLCQQYDVSRITVRQALNLLIQQDMAFSVHGKGTFVKPPAINHELNKIISFSRVLQQKGLKGHTRIQSFSPEIQDEAAQSRLGKNGIQSEPDWICHPHAGRILPLLLPSGHRAAHVAGRGGCGTFRQCFFNL